MFVSKCTHFAFSCSRAILADVVRGISKDSVPMVTGNLLHQVLQGVLVKWAESHDDIRRSVTREDVEEMIGSVLSSRENLNQLYATMEEYYSYMYIQYPALYSHTHTCKCVLLRCRAYAGMQASVFLPLFPLSVSLFSVNVSHSSVPLSLTFSLTLSDSRYSLGVTDEEALSHLSSLSPSLLNWCGRYLQPSLHHSGGQIEFKRSVFSRIIVNTQCTNT